MTTGDRPGVEGNQTILAALEQLRLKLLDLTGRNRLLNFKHSPGRSLASVAGTPTGVYDRLVRSDSRGAVAVTGIPEPPASRWIQQDGRRVRPEAADWAKESGISVAQERPIKSLNDGQFTAVLYPDDLAKHCRKLEREATLAIEETGANMLFLVVGFLEYPDQPEGERTFLAPLISVPVSLAGRNVRGQKTFEIEYTGEDIAANLSLQEKLRTDFGLILPAFDDDEEADVEEYLSKVAKLIANKPGFQLRRRISLCLLSFSNMLLVRDLDPRNWPEAEKKHSFLDHEVIRQLFEGKEDGLDTNSSSTEEHDVDNGPGAAVPLVFDADSSQHRALIDVLQSSRHVVIEGPPGTGKSQTITNLIAALIAHGKTVLFVSEKLAALEVVKSRLTLAGLDPFVLELHSSKTSKKRVLEEIDSRLKFRPSPARDMPRNLEQLTRYRSELRTYVNLMGSTGHNAMGLSTHALIWRAEHYRLQIQSNGLVEEPPEVKDATRQDFATFQKRYDALQHLQAQYREIGAISQESPFWSFHPERLVPGDERQITAHFASVAEWVNPFLSQAITYSKLEGGERAGLTATVAARLLDDLKLLRSGMPENQQLSQLPRLYAADSSGGRVRILLERLQTRIERHTQLLAPVQAALCHEEQAGTQELDSLREVAGTLRGYGCIASTSKELEAAANDLARAATELSSAGTRVRKFCESLNIPVRGNAAELADFEALQFEVEKLPEEHWHLNSPSLANPSAVEALEVLKNLQNTWMECYHALDRDLYLDSLPDHDVLRGAIATLREGPAWYRIFQGRWRAAIQLHRRLQRRKQKVTSDLRLADLESLQKLTDLQNRWRTDPRWKTYLGVSPASDPVPIDGQLAVANWHKAVRHVADRMEADPSAIASGVGEHPKRFKRAFQDWSADIATVGRARNSIAAHVKNYQQMPGDPSLEDISAAATQIATVINGQLGWMQAECHSATTIHECIHGLEAALERRTIEGELANASTLKSLLGEHFLGIKTDVRGLLAVVNWQQLVAGSAAPPGIRRQILHSEAPRGIDQCIAMVSVLCDGLKRILDLESALRRYGTCDILEWCGRRPEEDVAAFAERFKARAAQAAQQPEALLRWSQYVGRRSEAIDAGLIDFVRLLEDRKVEPGELPALFGYATYTEIVRHIFRTDTDALRFSGLKREQVIEAFRKLDKEIIASRGRAIASDATRRAYPPPGRASARVDERTEMALINHLIPQQRPRVPVRKLLARAQGAVQTLKPCLMMGPQAVAQFLEPGAITFDVVVMDEASQLRPEEALGAIARGRQLVVVGDPKQLPPTSFFARQEALDDDSGGFATTDSESILDLCLANFRPSRSLRWHYRSQHHSLIAFSNRQFYDSRLIICPSPYARGGNLGVRATYLSNAVYDDQTNLVEARRVVDAVVEHIRIRPADSLGVVTLNIKQRDLIDELLQEALSNLPEATAYRERWHESQQGLFVKNLENVQGDERDCILISTTYGRPPGAKVVRQNFGPISRQGGWRRLNVLFTRARKSIAIYTSLRPEDIVLEPSTPEGTKALRAYLEYARSGVLPELELTGMEPDSDFERAIIQVLRALNYEVTPQLGVSGFRIDIAVRHPEFPNAYLAGIECDGAQYHSAQSARDRDRIRQEILESLGWRGRIWRIWSTDWFRNPGQEIERLKVFLDRLRATWSPEHADTDSWVEEGSSAESDESSDIEQTRREIVNIGLLAGAEQLEVRVGDTIEFVDVAEPDSPQSVKITQQTTVLDQGLLAESAPLAQSLLGGVVGDEATLRVPGRATRTLRILAIRRPGHAPTPELADA